MASSIMEGVKKGAEVGVQIEEALEDLLVVSFHHGERIFRGVLLDTSKRDGPFGIPAARLSGLKAEISVQTDPTSSETLQLDSDTGKTWEPSSLSYRHTYGQDMPQPPPRPILKPRRYVSKGITKDKYERTRHIRLRPRQVLCSNCKNMCSQNSVIAKSSLSRTTPTAAPANSQIQKVEIRKRKAETSVPKHKEVKRLKKKEMKVENPTSKIETQTITKTSPLIKISFATPHGKGRVLKIPPRTHTTIKSSNPTKLSHHEHEKARKALKKAKDTIQLKSTTPIMVNGMNHRVQDNYKKHGEKRKSKYKHSNKREDRVDYQTYDFDDSDSEMSTATGDQNIPVVEIDKPYVDTSNNRLIFRTKHKKTKDKNKLKSLKPVLASLPTQKNKNSDDSAVSVSSEQSSSTHVSERSGLSDPYDFPSSDADEEKEKSLEQENKPRPSLTVRIHKKNVTKCTTPDGRTTCVGDVVWGKIQGFPWWPGRVVAITITRNDSGTMFNQEAKIAWFASSTASYMPCIDVHPFLEAFQKRYKKKKRGPYREAIKQATQACKDLSREVKQLNTMFEVS
ncbi:PWWP domain-containing protein 2A-like [Ptychodera flava]|uniref:PWWP domain-containing protein 2A-like n=1 Tax=Ptychodera flava TaxID=63121 RepID=UPI003969E531